MVWLGNDPGVVISSTKSRLVLTRPATKSPFDQQMKLSYNQFMAIIQYDSLADRRKGASLLTTAAMPGLSPSLWISRAPSP